MCKNEYIATDSLIYMNINIFVYRYVKVKILGVLSRFLKGGILCMFNYIATDSFMYIYIYMHLLFF